MQYLLKQIDLYFQYLLISFKPFIDFLKIDPVSRYLFAASIFLILVLAIIPKKADKNAKNSSDFNAKDINTIAGDDVVSTQLDLAKAYIEMDNKVLAKKMLKIIAKQGDQNQKKEAKQLMKAL